MPAKSLPISTVREQRGAILIAVLAILITLTLLGLAGIRSTTLEERMVGNFQEKYLAFQAAEQAARVAEDGLQTDVNAETPTLKFDGSDGTHDVTAIGGSVDPFSAFDGGASVKSVSVSGQHDGTGYYVERLPAKTLAYSSLVVGFQSSPPKVQAYRVTTRGYGKTGVTEVVVQSTWVE